MSFEWSVQNRWSFYVVNNAFKHTVGLQPASSTPIKVRNVYFYNSSTGWQKNSDDQRKYTRRRWPSPRLPIDSALPIFKLFCHISSGWFYVTEMTECENENICIKHLRCLVTPASNPLKKFRVCIHFTAHYIATRSRPRSRSIPSARKGWRSACFEISSKSVLL